MGEILHTIIKALEQRMDTGVLHELNVTRLHMLIGNELVKESLNLPDDNAYIELIEKAMLNYFQKDILETESHNKKSLDHDMDDKSVDENNSQPLPKDKKLNLQTPINFKLNIKKNEDNNQVIINQLPFIFSPLPVRNILTTMIISSLSNIHNDIDNEEEALKSIEETSFVKSIQLFTEVFHNIDSKVSNEQKIRLGLAIYRLLGYGDFQLEINSFWKITLFYSDSKLVDMDYFSLGFIRGIFVAADVDLYNTLGFAIANTQANSVITGSKL